MRVLLQTMDHAAQYKYAQEYLISKIKKDDAYKVIIFSSPHEKESAFKKFLKYKKRKKLFSLTKNIIGRLLYKKYINIFSTKTDKINLLINREIANVDIKSYKVNNEKDAKEIIEDFKPDRVVVIGSPFLSKNYFIDNIEYINLHIGMIPEYRGLKCLEWAILNSEPKEVGYSIHSMTPRLDHGDILEKQRIDFENLSLSEIYAKAYLSGIKSTIDLSMQEKLEPIQKISNKGCVYYTIDFTGYEAKKLTKKIKI